MKNVIAFMLGMAASIAVIKLTATKDGDDFDDFYDYEMEALLMANYNKPKQVVSEVERKREEKKALIAEREYELATLHHAIYVNVDQAEVERAKARLAEIHNELEALG